VEGGGEGRGGGGCFRTNVLCERGFSGVSSTADLHLRWRREKLANRVSCIPSGAPELGECTRGAKRHEERVLKPSTDSPSFTGGEIKKVMVPNVG